MKNKLIFLSIIMLFLSGCSSVAVNNNPLNSDSTAVLIESMNHQYEELGKVYSISKYESINNNNNYTILFKTDDKQVHLTNYAVIVDAVPVQLILYEGMSISNNGTSIDTQNQNRNNLTSSTTLVYSNPTIIDKGTMIKQYLMVGSKNVGGYTDSEFHLILKPNTYYGFSIVNNAGGSIESVTNIEWYEIIN